MWSLHRRVLAAGATVVIGFFAMAGLTLQQAFEHRQEIALQERLLGQVYVLIAAFEQDDTGRVKIPDVWRESKFSMLSPNLLADIRTQQGELVWQSYSMADVPIPATIFQHRNMSKLLYVDSAAGRQFALLRVAVAMNNNPNTQLFIFSIAENMAITADNTAVFMRNLWISLAVVALILLVLQSQSIRWVLSPLQIAEQELRAIEQGHQDKMNHSYPSELRGLTANINGLLSQQKDNLQRYRDTLGDLAHSLKTPLAVMQTVIDGEDASKKIVQQQIDIMSQITEYQLNRAASAGRRNLQAPESVRSVCQQVINSLQKVYKDKSISVVLNVDDDIMFHGDLGDLMEMLGNLLDNAFKWTHSCVHITAGQVTLDSDDLAAHLEKSARDVNETASRTNNLMEIIIEDDGVGIMPDKIGGIFERGMRAHEQMSGHGIGLSIVSAIVKTYQGKISAANSKLGGLKIILQLP